MTKYSRVVVTASISCAMAALLSTANAQNNFLDDGNIAALSKNLSIHNLAPETMTSWVPDRPTGDDVLASGDRLPTKPSFTRLVS